MIINALNGVWSNISSADHNPAKLRKADKNFPRELDFKDIKFPVKIRDIHKNCISISLLGYEKKNIQSMCQKILLKDMLIYL